MANFDYRKAIKENKATFHASLTEGQFSWMTQDTNNQIGSEKENTITVYMHDDKGKTWREDNYEGYGEFGGKDYYDLVAEMNGYTKDDAYELGGTFKDLRGIGIKLAFGDLEPKNGGPVLFPALTQSPRYPNGHDFTQEAENDPNQSWYNPEDDDYNEYEEDDDNYSWEDQYGDDEEELEEGTTNKMKVSELKAKIKEMILSEMHPKDEPDEMESSAWDMAMREEDINEYEKNVNITDEDPESEEDFLAEIVAMLEADDEEPSVEDTEETDTEETETDTEVDVDVEEPEPADDSTGDGGLKVNQNADADLTGIEKEVQDNLEAAMEAAKKLKDEKLQKQIGNSLTFFTRQHVVKENLNEVKFKIGDMLQTYGGEEKVKVLDIKPNLAAALADNKNQDAVEELEKDLRQGIINREDRNKPFYLVTSESFPINKYYIESELENLINESMFPNVKENIKETLLLQKRAGIITESQYKEKLNEAANIQDIISKLKAGDFAALEKHPADMKMATTIFNVLKQSQPELLKKLNDYAKQNKASLNEVSLKTTLLGALMALSLGMGVGSGFVKSTDKTPVDTEMTAQGQQSRELDKYKEDYETQQSAMRSAGYDKELMQDLVNFGEGKPIKNPVKLLKVLQRHDVNSANFGDFN